MKVTPVALPQASGVGGPFPVSRNDPKFQRYHTDTPYLYPGDGQSPLSRLRP